MSAEVSRLQWATRRGMLELDLILSRYLNQRYDSACDVEKIAFQTLLTFEDQQLFDWLIKAKPVPEDISCRWIVEKIRVLA